MSIEQNNKMREIMTLVEEYAQTQTNVVPVNESDEAQESQMDHQADQSPHPIIEELREVIFKLRSHTENGEGYDGESDEKALGVEEGMMRAADMIENLLRRYEHIDTT